MKRLSFLLALITVLSVGCTPGKPVAIGLIAPLTGPSSAVGTGVRNGFRMAFGESALKKGVAGRPIQLLIRDDQNDADVGLADIRELDSQGCRIVVLGTTSEAAAKVIPYANEKGIFVISPTVSDDSYNARDDLFFRVNASSSEYGKYLAERAIHRFGVKRPMLVGDQRNARYKDIIFDSFRKEIVSLGGSVAKSVSFYSNLPLPTDEIIDGITESGADGIVVVTASTEAALICKQLERAKMSLPTFLPPWPLTQDLIDNGGNAVEGIIAVSISDMEYSGDSGKSFLNDYRAAYGVTPSFTAVFGWETASILRRVFASVASAEPVALKRELLNIGTFNGVEGPIIFDRSGDASRTLFLYTIEHGRFKRLE